MKILILSTLLFIFFGCKAKLDQNYIVKREWISKSGAMIRFDDNSSILKNDAIFAKGKAYSVVRRLDKKYNRMKVYDLDDNSIIIYTSSEEFVK